ncbi:hypothetical protein GJ496_001283 [Pomphorhynchus laevis]|nr:hypothetical protein GJ496_001283 [Pomphorhynchus laevis]
MTNKLRNFEKAITYIDNDCDVINHIIDTSCHDALRKTNKKRNIFEITENPDSQSKSIAADDPYALINHLDLFNDANKKIQDTSHNHRDTTCNNVKLFAFPFQLSRKRKSIINEVKTTNNLKSPIADAAFEAVNDAHIKAKLSLLNHDEICEIVNSANAEFTDRTVRLTESLHEQLFKQWFVQMCQGFNIILYGVGSKRNILDNFRTKELTSKFHIVVEGYYHRMSMINLLDTIADLMFNKDTSDVAKMRPIDYIKLFEENHPDDIFLLIHNIDGPVLQLAHNQAILIKLAKIKGLHILATSDHINISTMWTIDQVEVLKWLWYNVSTWRSYTIETAFLQSNQRGSHRGKHSCEYIQQVLVSVTNRSQKVFQILLNEYLSCIDSKRVYRGIELSLLFDTVRRLFLASTEQTLREYLTEFKDHGLLTIKDNTVTLTIDKETAKVLDTQLKQSSET